MHLDDMTHVYRHQVAHFTVKTRHFIYLFVAYLILSAKKSKAAVRPIGVQKTVKKHLVNGQSIMQVFYAAGGADKVGILG